MKKLFDTVTNTAANGSGPTENAHMDIAIIGMTGRIGNAPDLDAFWQQLLTQEDFVTALSGQRMQDLSAYLAYAGVNSESIRSKPGAFFEEIDRFDHGFFNISHVEACSMAPDQRIFLEQAWHVLEDAGYAGRRIRGSRTGIYLGYAREENSYLKMVTGLEPELGGMALTGNVASVMAGRVAHFLDLKGPTMLINTACSSSLVALHQACQALRAHDCDMALTGGINLHLSPLQGPGDSAGLGVESASGMTRSFDDWSDGTGGGEGCIVFLLKPLHKALQDNDRVHAVIKGTAINQDGSAINIAAPNVKAQEEVLLSAWKNARIDPQTIAYIEAHGTGTPLGDPIEVAGITAAFRHYTQRRQFCALSALKSNIGHLDAAAGAAGMLKAVLSLKHGVIAPVAHFDKPNKHIPFESSPVYVNTRPTQWHRNGAPRRCGVSSFGLSGTNAHVVLEEAPPPAFAEDITACRLFTVSAMQVNVLRSIVARYVTLLDDTTLTLGDICYTAAAGRGHFPLRLAVLANSREELRTKLQAWLEQGRGDEVYMTAMAEDSHYVAAAQQLRALNREVAQWMEDNEGSLQDAASLGRLATWYIAGADINWEELYAGEKRTVVTLPLYAFQPKRCWVTIPEKQAALPTVAEGTVVAAGPVAQELIPVRPLPLISKEEIFRQFRDYFSQSFDIPAAGIGPETNVYDIGLDSISIIQVRRLIKKQYAIDVPVIDLFKKYVKIGDLAAHIEEKLGQSSAAVAARPKQTSLPPVPTGGVAGELQQIRDRIDALLHQLPEPGQNVPGEKRRVLYTPALQTLAKPVHAVASNQEAEPLDTKQEAYIAAFSAAYQQRSAKSLQFTREHMPHFANNRNVSGFKKIYRKLQYTIIADHVAGSRIWDLDGNEYVDFAMGFGVHFMGHNHPLVRAALEAQLEKGAWLGPLSALPGEVAGLIAAITGVERVAFYNSGTEAVMVAIRLARAATGRNKIVIFSGSYHGMFDGLLAIRNPYAETYETAPIANGILQSMVEEVYVLEYDDPAALAFIREHAAEIAAVVTEPVQSRRPELQPFEFLAALRQSTADLGICLIFDEIITGFRILPGGSQQYFNVQADLVTYGKVVGGGLPLGIVAGKAEYLHGIDGGQWDPTGETLPRFDHRRTIVAGTFCHHPLAMASAKVMLQYIQQEGVALYERLNNTTSAFVQRVNAWFEAAEVPIRLYNFGSMFHFRSALDLKLFFYHLIHKGIYVWEGATFFISTVHTDDDLLRFEQAIRESITDLRHAGLMPKESQEGKRWPLTGEQLKIWLRSQESPEASATFHELITFSLKGAVNEDVVRACLQQLMQRHAALSIRDIGAAGQLIPDVAAELPFVRISAGGDTAEERLQYAESRLRQEMQTPFRPGGLLARAFLITCEEEHHIFGLIIHQLIADGYSLSLVQSELETLYTALSSGRKPVLQEAAGFGDYLRLSARLAADREALQAFWSKDWQQAFPEPFVSNPFAPAGVYTQRWMNTIMPDQFYGELKAYARTARETPFVVLLSAFTALTGMLTRRQDVLVGIPSVGQLLLDNPCVAGQCMQLLPLRWRLQDQPATEMIAGIGSKFNQLLEYRDFVIEDIISFAASQGQPCHMPVVRIVFNMDPAIQTADAPAGVSAFSFTAGAGALAKYDLFVNVVEVNRQLHFSFQYSTAVFNDAAITYWMESYFAILRQMITAPAVPISADISGRPQPGEDSALTRPWLEMLSAYLDFPPGTQLWLSQQGLLPEEIAGWQWIAGEKGWQLFAGAQLPVTGEGQWVICGDSTTLISPELRTQLLPVNVSAWIMISEQPLTSIHLQQLPFTGIAVQLHVVTRLPGSGRYLFHGSGLYRLQTALQLLPAGKALSPLLVTTAAGRRQLPGLQGRLQLADDPQLSIPFTVSYTHEGDHYIWAADADTLLYRGYTLGRELLQAAEALLPADQLDLFLPRGLRPVKKQEAAPVKDPARAALLLECAATVLHYPQLQLQDNFLEAGGTSIQAIHLSAILRDKMGWQLSPSRLFAADTLEALLWEEAAEKQETVILPLPEQKYYPLSHAQKRFWIVEQLETSVHTAILTETRRIQGPVKEPVFHEACRAVVDRHESLRTIFVLHDGQPVQQVVAPGDGAFDYRFEDWQLLEAEADERIDELTTHELNTAFRLDQGPVLRIRLIQTGPETFITLLVTHHIIFDGWSFDVLMQDIIMAYKQLLNAKAPFTEALPFQLKDYSSWHNEWISAQLEQLQGFWAKQFRTLPPVLRLHTAERPALKQARAGKHTLILEPEFSGALFRSGKSCKASMFMVVQSSLLALLYCYTRETDLCIGTPVADRQHEALQRQIGCLINTLAIRTTFSTTDTYLQLLTRVRQNTLAAFEHQQYPFELVLNDISYARDPSRNPLFDIGYTFHEMEYLSGMQGVTDLGIHSELIPPKQYSVKTDLWFHAAFNRQSLAFTILYDMALFNSEFMDELTDGYRFVLETLAVRPAIMLEELMLRFGLWRQQRAGGIKAQAVSRQRQLLKEIKGNAKKI